MEYEFLDPQSEKNKLWEEARQWAVAEILAKYHKELKEAHSKQFSRLTQRAPDGLPRATKEDDPEK